MVAQETRAEGEALRQQAEAAEKLQPLRDEEAARAAVLHRLSVERDALEREEARAKARQAELETRLAQASRDLAREEEHIAEAEGMLRRLEHEARRLEEASSRDHEEPQLREAAALAAIALAAAEGAFSAATEDLARARAEWRSLAAEHTELGQRIALLERQSGDIATGACEARSFERRRHESSRRSRRILPDCPAWSRRSKPSLLLPRPARKRPRQAKPSPAHPQQASSCRSRSYKPSLPRCSSCSSPQSQANGRRSSMRCASAEATSRRIGAGLGDDLDAASDEAAPAHWRVTAGEGDPQLPRAPYL